MGNHTFLMSYACFSLAKGSRGGYLSKKIENVRLEGLHRKMEPNEFAGCVKFQIAGNSWKKCATLQSTRCSLSKASICGPCPHQRIAMCVLRAVSSLCVHVTILVCLQCNPCVSIFLHMCPFVYCHLRITSLLCWLSSV